jgi:hypothetical protein
VAPLDLEFDLALRLGVEGVVLAAADIISGVELGAALAQILNRDRCGYCPPLFYVPLSNNLCLDLGYFDFSIALPVALR